MRRAFLTITVIGVLGASLLAASAASSSGRPSTRALELASPQLAGWSYRLDSLASCQVGDGIALVVNDANRPIRITEVRMTSSGGGPLLAASRWSYQLVSFKEGSTTGEVAGSFALASLGGGRRLGDAIGGVLDPVVGSGRWYDVVARRRIPARTAAWEIRGIVINYELGSHGYTARFAQAVTLPATAGCRGA